MLIFALLGQGTSLAQPASPQAVAVSAPVAGFMCFVENAGQWSNAAR
jgi:hypothetical protein